jgi:hypothetical protein
MVYLWASFSSIWAGIFWYVQNKDQDADAGLIFSILAFERGIGNICSGLSAMLLLTVSRGLVKPLELTAQSIARSSYSQDYQLCLADVVF